MSSKLLPVVLMALLCNLAAAAEIYRWTDEKGKVHFGDKPNVPPGEVKRIDTSGANLSESQRREAELRAMRDRNEATRDLRKPVQGSTASKTQTAKEKCEEEWRRYNEAQACFNRGGRNANGSLKGGVGNCVEVKQPERCD